MKLQISTKDHGVITSDELASTINGLHTTVSKALTGEGYLQFHVNNVVTTVPYGVLGTSIIKIIE
jgi:hypothetical protein